MIPLYAMSLKQTKRQNINYKKHVQWTTQKQ